MTPNTWQYLGHVEPPQTIARDLPIPWMVEPEVPVRRAGLPTALLVTACFLVPSAVNRPVDWLPLLETPRIDPVLVDGSTGAERPVTTIVRDLRMPWMPGLAEPTLPPAWFDPASGSEWIPLPFAVVTPLEWWPIVSEPVRTLEPVVDWYTGAEELPETITVLVPIPWAHQTEVPMLAVPTRLEPATTGGIPVTVTALGVGWIGSMAEPDVGPGPLLYATGGELPSTTIIRVVVDRRYSDQLDRVGSRDATARRQGI